MNIDPSKIDCEARKLMDLLQDYVMASFGAGSIELVFFCYQELNERL